MRSDNRHPDYPRVYDRDASSAILNMVSNVGLNNVINALIDTGNIIPDNIIMTLFRNTHDLDLHNLSKHQIPPLELMLKYPDKLDWQSMSVYVGNWISINDVRYSDFISTHIKNGNLDPEIIIHSIKKNSKDTNLTLLKECINKYLKSLNAFDTLNYNEVIGEIFSVISSFECLTLDFINDYKKYINYWILTSNEDLSMIPVNMFIDHMNSVNWANILFRRKFPEDILEKLLHADGNKAFIYPKWQVISMYQDLTEEFIIRHIDEVSWTDISEYQKLSLQFLTDYREFIDVYALQNNHNIPKDVKRDFMAIYHEKVSLEQVMTNIHKPQKPSEEDEYKVEYGIITNCGGKGIPKE